MTKIKHLFIGVMMGAAASVAHADQTRWVSDDLHTYVRSGPTDGYRIVGTVDAGEKVTLLETQGDYSRIRSGSGDTVWIRSDELQNQRSRSERMPELQQKVSELTTRLNNIDSEWESKVSGMTETLDVRQSRIAELEARTQKLDQQLAQAQSQAREYQARLDTERDDLLMRYFMYGGGVAGAGLLLGLIVPHLPRRRKRRDRWF
ncbi:TIGR04211 family SH3 domain-containing protein [Phytohalomonas tamaricis]|uniref:TIGR04211 family SH3 domain-containing protein n=1 Tax=Phytohalomonas tamaricis TaxID=2081032 RepID=UPI000D0B6210|nr:TIGR04211 family SH3 domain-containing protein [Phytohalomonas tamaricis]